MKKYKQVLETVELALNKGEYNFCIEYISPLIKTFPLSSKEGDNLRTILITALCGVNKKNEAKGFCKELLKSNDFKTRENAKYLMEIIDSPEIKKPENWNIKIDDSNSPNKTKLNSLKNSQKIKKKKKFIDITNVPTGETKPFQNGFIFVIIFLLILLFPLLSGCVKIEDTLDLRNTDLINNELEVESKYIKKSQWQLNFENKIKEVIPDSIITKGDLSFSLKNNNLNFIVAKDILYKIQKIGGELAGSSSDLQITNTENNFLFLKKSNYKIDFDLRALSEVEDLELKFNIINPNKVFLKDKNNNQIESIENKILWTLIPGKINILEFSFWHWNHLLIGILLITIILLIAYLIRFYRYQIGSDLPELPSS